MFNGMNPQLMQILMGQQGGNPTGFTNPGTGNAPQLPQVAHQQSQPFMPQMPSAFNPQGQMNGQTPQGTNGQQAGAAGMFSQLAQNPQMAAMMQQLHGAGQPPQMQGPMPDGSAMPQPNQNAGLMAYLQHMFGGGAGQ